MTQVFWVFLRLGLTSFGGPVAHLGYFRNEFVERRGWLSDRAFADLVVLCQFLPGPASSQVGMAIGLQRAGFPGFIAAWVAFTLHSAALLLSLPSLATATGNATVSLFDSVYRAGSLVFGGGHVVLPLLQAETVQTGLVDPTTFLTGYGAAQAVPGPLFAFAAFLGAVTTSGPTGALGASIAVFAIFLPSALLVIGVLPAWERLRRIQSARGALAGVNAGVVGLLAAALYDPVFTDGITGPLSLAIAAVAFVALTAWRTPAWAVVLGAAALGALLL